MTERSRGFRGPAANSVAVAAMIVAVFALLLSMGDSGLGAPPNPAREVELLTTATGSATFQAGGGVPTIPLDGAEFIQEAGGTVLLVSHLTMTAPESPAPDDSFDECGAVAYFEARPATEGEQLVATELTSGFGGIPVGDSKVLGLAPPDIDLAYEIVTGGAHGDCTPGVNYVPPDITVELEVAVLALR